MKYFDSIAIIFGQAVMLFELFIIVTGKASGISYFNLIGSFVIFSMGIIFLNYKAYERRGVK